MVILGIILFLVFEFGLYLLNNVGVNTKDVADKLVERTNLLEPDYFGFTEEAIYNGALSE